MEFEVIRFFGRDGESERWYTFMKNRDGDMLLIGEGSSEDAALRDAEESVRKAMAIMRGLKGEIA